MTRLFRRKYFRILFFTITLIVMMPIISIFSFAEEEAVRVFVDKVAQQLIDVVKSPNVSLENKRNRVREVINESFDIVWMSRFAMGVNYRRLSDAQKERYKLLYLNYLVNNYFPILIKYNNNDSYEILTIKQVDKQDYDVKVKLITNESQNPVMLRYRIRRANAEYKCLDMVVEGVSTLISQRAEFASIIQRSGINYLLQQLELKQNNINKKINILAWR